MTIKCAAAYVRDLARRPWLVLGKGPSLARLPEVKLGGYHVLTLNHACLAARPTIAHFVDWSAWNDCRKALAAERGDTAVCLPWHPHFGCKPSERTLEELIDGSLYYDFAVSGRLLSYNASTAGRLPDNPRLAHIRVRLFGAVAAFNLLARAGVKKICTLGIDGGKDYCPGFDPKDKLVNGQPDFDVQFPEIKRTVRANRIMWERL